MQVKFLGLSPFLSIYFVMIERLLSFKEFLVCFSLKLSQKPNLLQLNLKITYTFFYLEFERTLENVGIRRIQQLFILFSIQLYIPGPLRSVLDLIFSIIINILRIRTFYLTPHGFGNTRVAHTGTTCVRDLLLETTNATFDTLQNWHEKFFPKRHSK